MVPISEQSIRRAQDLLAQFGFPPGPADGRPGPRTTAAVRRFQEAWCGGKSGQGRLAVDGVLGPLTLRALDGLPHLSPHFTVDELRSKGDRTCYVRWPLLAALEALRRADGDRALPLVSGYRDPLHNKRVGGATNSVHLLGLAADLGRTIDADRVRGLRQFSGLGLRSGRVSHVDLRHLAGGGNRTGGTPDRPTVWVYG